MVVSLSWFDEVEEYFDEFAEDYFGEYANAAKAGAKLVGPSSTALGATVGGFAGVSVGPPGIVAGCVGGGAVGAVVGSAVGALLGVAMEKASLALTGEPAFAPDATFP